MYHLDRLAVTRKSLKNELFLKLPFLYNRCYREGLCIYR